MTRPASNPSGHAQLLKVTAVAAMMVLAACGGGSKNASSPGSPGGGAGFTAGLITKTDTNPFFVKMKEGASKEAKAKGGKLLSAAGKFDGDNASQVTAIENMVAGGVKGILITPSDTKAIVPAVQKARAKGVMVIALDTPTDPQSAVDALFATNNFTAGQLIGMYAKGSLAGKQAKIATLDLAPGITVGVLRHNGFLNGFGATTAGATETKQISTPDVVCSNDTQGDQAKGQTAMENCLQKAPDVNLVYTINEPAALGAYTALKNAGKEKSVLMVSVDGGCAGVRAIKDGKIAATSQQYPLKMAAQGIDAIAQFAQGGAKASGYTDTGVTLITDKLVSGVASKDTAYGLANCWG
jgi:fructose transport system substrate-binding protein